MRRKQSLFVLMLLFAAALAGRPNGVTEADGPTQASPRELRIERSLACPQCTDLPVDVCDRAICNDMRAIIKQKIAAGESDAAIRQYFVSRYGTRVLLAPPAGGFHIVNWLMPFFGLLVGGLAAFAFLRCARRRPRDGPPESAADSGLSEYRVRVEREIEGYE